MINPLSTSAPEPPRIKCKITFIGDYGAGKTSLVYRMTQNQFKQEHIPTIGIDFAFKLYQHNGRSVKLQFWETSGQQKFQSLIPSYLKDSVCAVIVYDVSNRKSLQNVQQWMKMLEDCKSVSTIPILVGNKGELDRRQFHQQKRSETTELLDQIIGQFQFKHFIVSAKQSYGLEKMTENILQIAIQASKCQPL